MTNNNKSNKTNNHNNHNNHNHKTTFLGFDSIEINLVLNSYLEILLNVFIIPISEE